MKLKVVIALAAVVGLLVLFVEGLNSFAVWNLFPVLLVLAGATAAQLVPDSGSAIRGRVVVPSLAIPGVVAFAHLAWQFDWGQTATGSSTSGLIFIFIPIWSLIVGGVVAVISLLGRRLLWKKTNGA
jgi:hypothetical protein